MEPAFEPSALDLLRQVAARNWPIIVHPDAMHTPRKWAALGDCLCIENMDKRKPAGRTLSEAWTILQLFHDRIKQLHVSEVNTQSRHDRLSIESVLAFKRVSHLVPANAPIILKSRVEESEINEEIQNALDALNPATQFAIASD